MSELIVPDNWSNRVIGSCIEVHRALGPGFLESVYESGLDVQFQLDEIPFQRQPVFPIQFKGQVIGEHRPDFVVGGELIRELKAVERILPIHVAQCISYLKATGFKLALLVNFNVPKLVDGIKRIVL
jgi:GxxExxY protein